MEVNVPDKLAVLDEWRKEMGLCWKEVAYLGWYHKVGQDFFFFFLRTREIRKKIPDWHNCREVGTLYTTEESTNLGWPFWWLV